MSRSYKAPMMSRAESRESMNLVAAVALALKQAEKQQRTVYVVSDESGYRTQLFVPSDLESLVRIIYFGRKEHD